MVFLRKSAAHSCRARGPECHRSRLIYQPPLSSCYAWSLNFPFLLFFPCFFSQIPPLVLPDPPHPPSTSHFSMQPSLSCRTLYVQRTHRRVNFLAPGSPRYSKICHVGRPPEPKCDVRCTNAHLRTLQRIHLHSPSMLIN